MNFHRALLLTALAAAPLAGCPANNSDPPVPAPAPVESTAPPSPPTTTTEAPTVTEPYRVITDNVGKSNVEFTLMINGATVGSYNTDKVENDISSYLQSGQNIIKVAWTADGSMKSYEKAQLKIQTQRAGNWNDIVTREVTGKTAAGESEINIQVGPIDTNAPAAQQPTLDIPNQPLSASPTETTPVEQVPVAPANANPSNLSDSYIVKTVFHPWSPGEFNISVNGTQIGSYSSKSNRDITSNIKPGRNRVTVAWQAADSVRSSVVKSTLTIGVNRGGKWSTVGNASINSKSLSGKKTFEFTAQ